MCVYVLRDIVPLQRSKISIIETVEDRSSL